MKTDIYGALGFTELIPYERMTWQNGNPITEVLGTACPLAPYWLQHYTHIPCSTLLEGVQSLLSFWDDLKTYEILKKVEIVDLERRRVNGGQ